MPSSTSLPPIALFGYHASPFTYKIRLILRLRQIPYTFVLVPSMMPRPTLVSSFNLTYRKIPVLAIGKDVYIDTSCITEALHAHPAFQDTSKYPSIHGNAHERALSRVWASHFTDRPFFRLTTGLIPASVWRTNFGTDRASLIGHKLDADKLEGKVPSNLARLDTQLSVLEPMFTDNQNWILNTPTPTFADVAFWEQLDWGEKISRGEGFEDLTGEKANDNPSLGMSVIFNEQRYPGLVSWFNRFKKYIDDMPDVEKSIVAKDDVKEIDRILEELNSYTEHHKLIPTSIDSAGPILDNVIGLQLGERISVTPDDTGRGDPTYGKLVAASTEEIVIVPDSIEGVEVPKVRGVRLHFPRIGFVVKPAKGQEKARAKL